MQLAYFAPANWARKAKALQSLTMQNGQVLMNGLGWAPRYTVAELSRLGVESNQPVADDAMAGELLVCEDCGAELELTSLDPVTLAEAPSAEEDWGQ